MSGSQSDVPTDPPVDAAADMEAADTRSDGSSVPFDVRESTPNSGGPQGASGGMGVSSERTGPDAPGEPGHGITGHGITGHGITGTGTTGDARTRTDGTFDSSPLEWDAPDVALGNSEKAGQGGVGAGTTSGLSGRPDTTGRSDRDEEQRYVEGTEDGAADGVAPQTAEQGPVLTEGDQGVDRTVGEPNTRPLGGDRPHDTGRDNPV